MTDDVEELEREAQHLATWLYKIELETDVDVHNHEPEQLDEPLEVPELYRTEGDEDEY